MPETISVSRNSSLALLRFVATVVRGLLAHQAGLRELSQVPGDHRRGQLEFFGDLSTVVNQPSSEM